MTQVQLDNFKIICDEMYGKSKEFTQALKSTMRRPNGAVIYNGKKWSYQGKQIKTYFWDRLVHIIFMYISKSYQKKFRAAIKPLFRATVIYHFDSEHSQQVDQINLLEKRRHQNQLMVSRLLSKVIESEEKIQITLGELTKIDKAMQEHCNQKQITRPTPEKNNSLRDLRLLKKAGVTLKFLDDYVKITDQIQEMCKKRLTDKEKATLQQLNTTSDEMNEKFKNFDLPMKFKEITLDALINHLEARKWKINYGATSLSKDPQYGAYKQKIEENQASLKQYQNEKAVHDNEYKKAKMQREQLTLEVQSFVTHLTQSVT